MKSICIGVYLHTEPGRLEATLASLRANTPVPFELLLLPDGPDARMKGMLADLKDVTQAATAEPLGTAACFNRLVNYNDADVCVLLESGSLVAPGWLDHLLGALSAEPGNGLAGPSTNICWNEQNAYPRSGGTTFEIARTARRAEEHFGAQTRLLGPLYSLADFCYVVKREVVRAIGGADERYKLGPCWEMDYNVRAARAGFRGVWACAAYVHRLPFTHRRRLEESRHFEASKRLYQQKFCGARLRGEKSDFRSHCRGDACANFAPPEFIQLQHPLPLEATAPWTLPPPLESEQPVIAPWNVRASDHRAIVAENDEPQAQDQKRRVEFAPDNAPLVSCIMPTFNRRRYLPQSLRCFLGQDYPHLELIVVDDGTDPIADCLPNDPRIRYIRLHERLRLGAKRNLACAEALGAFIVHWDDDDWYPSWRVGAQVRALVEGPADVSGTSRIFYYDAAAGRAWEYRYPGRRSKWVGGNTLAYRKSFWERNRFPEIQVGEDSRFLWGRASKTICDLAEPSLCVASIHPQNTSRKMVRGTLWHPQPLTMIDELLGHDRYFYRTHYSAARADDWPLVSCIMPTFNRRSFVQLALRCFASQDYPHRELIIVDDGDDATGELTQHLPGVHYIHLPQRTAIGAKRNLACLHARGEFIAHWDDDDWYGSDRLRYQVAPLLAGDADMTGLVNSFVLELPSGKGWAIRPQLHRKIFVGDVHGGTLVYRRELWHANGLRYPETNLAEDAWLLHRAVQAGKRLLRLDNPGVFVYVRHGRNAWKQFKPGTFINTAGWEQINLPSELSEDVLDLYKHAAALLR